MGKFTPEMKIIQSSGQGMELKLARIRKGFHLYEVARQVGISPARLSQYEGEHRQIPPDLEERLRGILGLSDGQRRGDEEE
jgi:transcriptional regulator with XRE-family HTH domain